MILEKFINPIFSYFKTEAQFFNKFVGFFVGKFDELKFSRYIFYTTHRLYLAQKSLAFLIGILELQYIIPFVVERNDEESTFYPEA